MEKPSKMEEKDRVIGVPGKVFGLRSIGDAIIESVKTLQDLIHSKRESVQRFLHHFFFAFNRSDY